MNNYILDQIDDTTNEIIERIKGQFNINFNGVEYDNLYNFIHAVLTKTIKNIHLLDKSREGKE